MGAGSVEEAIELQRQLQELFLKGGFLKSNQELSYHLQGSEHCC